MIPKYKIVDIPDHVSTRAKWRPIFDKLSYGESLEFQFSDKVAAERARRNVMASMRLYPTEYRISTSVQGVKDGYNLYAWKVKKE